MGLPNYSRDPIMAHIWNDDCFEEGQLKEDYF